MKDNSLTIFQNKKNIAIAILSILFIGSCSTGIANNKADELNTANNKIIELESKIKDRENKLKDTSSEAKKEQENLAMSWEKHVKTQNETIEQLKKEIESYQEKEKNTAVAQASSTAPQSEHTPTQQPIQQETTTALPKVHYKNCKEVRAAGAAPIYKGQPGYGKHLDRDGDGVGCE